MHIFKETAFQSPVVVLIKELSVCTDKPPGLVLLEKRDKKCYQICHQRDTKKMFCRGKNVWYLKCCQLFVMLVMDSDFFFLSS